MQWNTRLKYRAFGYAVLALAPLAFWSAPARADDEGDWQNIGADVANMVADNLLSWIEGPLAENNLTIDDDPGFVQPNPDEPVIVIKLYVDAPWPASNKTIIIEIYPDGRVKVTTIHHKITGDETVVEWRDDIIPPAAKRWLWGPPEVHDLTGNPIDIWSEGAAVQQIKERVQPIVEQRVYQNIANMIEAILALLKILLRIFPL